MWPKEVCNPASLASCHPRAHPASFKHKPSRLLCRVKESGVTSVMWCKFRVNSTFSGRDGGKSLNYCEDLDFIIWCLLLGELNSSFVCLSYFFLWLESLFWVNPLVCAATRWPLHHRGQMWLLSQCQSREQMTKPDSFFISSHLSRSTISFRASLAVNGKFGSWSWKN